LSKCCCGEVTVEISYYITWWSLGCLVYYLHHWCFWFMVILFILLSFIYLLIWLFNFVWFSTHFYFWY
jgi:hypothetical protein